MVANMGYSIGSLICVVGFKHMGYLGLSGSFGLGKHILFFFSFFVNIL